MSSRPWKFEETKYYKICVSNIWIITAAEGGEVCECPTKTLRTCFDQRTLVYDNNTTFVYCIILSALIDTTSFDYHNNPVNQERYSPFQKWGICSINKAEPGLKPNPSICPLHHIASILLHLIQQATHES